MSRPRADRDERPTVSGSRVALAAELGAELPGWCVGVPLDLSARWCLFDGERAPILVPLELLRRLP